MRPPTPTPAPIRPDSSGRRSAIRGWRARRLSWLVGCLVLLMGLGVVFRTQLRGVAHVLRQRWRTERAEWRRRHERVVAWEILSMTKLTKEQGAALQPGTPGGRFSLDDPAPLDYQMVRLRLHSEGPPIASPLHFQWSAGPDDFIKILDVTLVPAAGSLVPAFTHNLPPLQWRSPEPGEVQLLLRWNAPFGATAGYHVYQSGDKDVGFGRIDEALLHDAQFPLSVVPATNAAWRFFKVSAVNSNGVESDLSPEVVLGDVAGWLPTFKGAARVEPSTNAGPRRAARPGVFPSVDEALRSGTRYETLIVPVAQLEQARAAAAATGTRILGDDCLDCLRGKVRFDLPRGLEQGAEVQIEIVCKARPGLELAPSLKLEQGSGVTLTNHGSTTFLMVPWPPNPAPSKALLTPASVRSYASENSILVVWDSPNSSAYSKVSIWRTPDAAAAGTPPIYQGWGSTNDLRLTWDVPRPPGRGDSPQAAPGYGLGSSNHVEEIRALHFVDTAVASGMVYTYTLVAQDRAGHQSYPLVFKASLRDHARGFRWSESAPVR